MKNKINKLIDIAISYTFNSIFMLFCKLKETRVLFISDVNNTLVQNLKCIYEELEKKEYSKYEKVVALNDNRKRYRNILEKIRTIYFLSTAKYVIMDDLVIYTGAMKVRKNQKLCQLWHGAGAFKKFGYSRKNGDLKHIHKGYKKYTNVITSAESIRGCYAEAFGVDMSNVKATGIPRTDMFVNSDYIAKKKEEIYSKYPNVKGKKVILFAPTYRSSKISKAFYDIKRIDLDKIYNEFKDDYVFIFKWHPAMKNNIPIRDEDLKKYNNFFLDLSCHEDINELFFVTDIFITDYSSAIFDYFLLNKPIIFFVPDLDEYKNTRGIYYDFSKYIYGEVAGNTESLISYIKEKNMMNEKRETFNQEFMNSCDGKATQKTIEWIFEKIK